ncbi:hypothetical protein SeLEV6574_g03024 [Synchytrium endobioticum]|uniref:Protein-serine/threonine kinase n=1 Tax=Synchytrium endobioticum TaxID=286115 RepID=A0A507D5R6_9FUNG|nr:hypothetical protein SeLEV6574_g03024 [Synchytrium endobioticum]
MTQIPRWALQRIVELAKSTKPTCIKFSDMLKFGANPKPTHLLASSQFLSHEIPVRLAHRFHEMGSLPYNISQLEVVKKVKSWYAKSFQELVEFGEQLEIKRLNPDAAGPAENQKKPFFPSILSTGRQEYDEMSPLAAFAEKNGMSDIPQLNGISVRRDYFGDIKEAHIVKHAEEYNERFARILRGIVERHNPAVLTAAQAVNKLRHSHPILIGHHASLILQKQSSPNRVGIVNTRMDPGDVASDAAVDAAEKCEETLGVAPRVEIQCPVGGCPHMTFVPSHLHHVLFEVLKNSMRAVVEKEEQKVGFGNAERNNMPPIVVSIIEPSSQQIQIRISDQGVGISAENLPRLFTYAFTTAKAVDIDEHFSGDEVHAPLAGFGYGLPLSRLYVKYFNGSLWIESTENVGTDVTILLRKSFDGTETFTY